MTRALSCRSIAVTVVGAATVALTVPAGQAVGSPQAASPPGHVARSYAVQDAALPGYPTGIDDRGDLVTTNEESFEVDGYVRSAGAVHRLQPGSQFTYSGAVNAHGMSVGTASSAFGVPVAQEWNARGENTPLVSLPGAGADEETAARPEDINKAGTIVGSEGNASGASHAVFWTSPTAIHVVPTGGSAEATAINDDGLIGGTIDGHAAEFDRLGRLRTLERLPDEVSSSITDLNDRGIAVCVSTTSNGDVPVRWSASGAVSRLPAPAAAINDDGVMAGNLHGRPVVWRFGHPLTVLPDLPYPPGSGQANSDHGATAINDRGVIAGWTVRDPGQGGYVEAVTWTPA